MGIKYGRGKTPFVSTLWGKKKERSELDKLLNQKKMARDKLVDKLNKKPGIGTKISI